MGEPSLTGDSDAKSWTASAAHTLRMPFLMKVLVVGGSLVLVTALLFACGAADSPTEGSPGGATSGEGGADGPAPNATAADGGGVCCPLANPCSPGYRGGWAPTAAECVYENSYDGKFDKLVDDHGCAYWRSSFATGKDMCCGCVIPRDASADADAGADADAESDAN